MTLEEEGRAALANVTMSKSQNEEELEQLRFRDLDLSAAGGALLGFSGLMLAADLVFLSADPDSFIAADALPGWMGFGALFVLALGSLFATLSIIEPGGIRHQRFKTPFEFFGAVNQFHERRRTQLATSRILTAAGTILFLLGISISVVL